MQTRFLTVDGKDSSCGNNTDYQSAPSSSSVLSHSPGASRFYVAALCIAIPAVHHLAVLV